MAYNVAQIIATNFYGGPEKQITEHIKRLDKYQDYQGILISFIENGQRNEILEQANITGIKNFGIPMSHPLDISALFKLIRLIRHEKIDLICAHHYKSVVMGWFAARYTGIPVLNYSRGFTGESVKIRFYEWLERIFVRKMDGIISVSEGQKKKLESFGIKKDYFRVVHNGVEIKLYDRTKSISFRKNLIDEFNIPENSLLALCVGRLSVEKGHKFLFEAIGRLKPKNLPICFLICGEGALKEKLIGLASGLNINEKVRFLGFRRDMDMLYQASDFLVLPSLTEGLPNVVLEAFAYSKPVIASAVGGVPEIVEDRINGLLVPPGESVQLAVALERITRDDQMLQNLGLEGFEKIKEQFTYEAQTDQLVSIYDHFLSQNKAVQA